MNIQQAERFLLNLQPGKVDLDLNRLRRVLNELGLKAFKTPTVLVGGTNGKGSVIAFSERILNGSCRIGSFIKPHIFSVLERVRIDGKTVEPDIFSEAVSFLKKKLERCEVNISFFEATLLTALLVFDLLDIEICLVEVGLGGRFDASNVLPRAITAITGIAYDHEAYLGSNLSSIAFEKAGILSEGVPLLLSRSLSNGNENSSIPYSLITRLAKLKGAELYPPLVLVHRANADPSLSIQFFSTEQLQVGRGTDTLVPKTLFTNLLGIYQEYNLELAINLSIVLLKNIIKANLIKIPEKLAVDYRGRFEVQRSGAGIVIFDAAHNEQGFQVLNQTIEAYFPPEERFLLLFGCQQGKNILNMVKHIKHKVVGAIPIHLPILHPEQIENIKDALEILGINCLLEKASFKEKTQYAKTYVREGGNAIVAGSIYYLGPIMEAFGYGKISLPQLNM